MLSGEIFFFPKHVIKNRHSRETKASTLVLNCSPQFLSWGRSLAILAWCPGSYQLAGLQFGDLHIWCWENYKTAVWTNGTRSACYSTPGSIAKTVRRLDLDDERLWRADLGLLVSTPAQRASYGLLNSPFLRQEYFTFGSIFEHPPNGLFLCFIALMGLCYFWTFVAHQKVIYWSDWVRGKGRVWRDCRKPVVSVWDPFISDSNWVNGSET